MWPFKRKSKVKYEYTPVYELKESNNYYVDVYLSDNTVVNMVIPSVECQGTVFYGMEKYDGMGCIVPYPVVGVFHGTVGLNAPSTDRYDVYKYLERKAGIYLYDTTILKVIVGNPIPNGKMVQVLTKVIRKELTNE